MRISLQQSAVVALALAFGAVLHAEPLPTTNQNPLLASAALPLPLPPKVSASQTDLSATLNWGSTAIIDSDANEILLVDAETRDLRLALTHGFSDRLALRIELPYLHTGGGTLDGFIDDFHDAFGFSEGDRPLFRNDQLTLWYLRSGRGSFVNRTKATSGVGDLSASLGAGLLRTEHSAVSAWISVAAPTAADGAYVADGDDWKFSATLSGERHFGRRWTTFAQASATGHTGDGVFGQQKSVIWSGIAGVEFAASRRIGLNAQVQANTAPLDGASLDYLRDAVVLTVGGSVQASDAFKINLGLSEDIKVEASPDAVFVLGVSTHF